MDSTGAARLVLTPRMLQAHSGPSGPKSSIIEGIQRVCKLLGQQRGMF